MAIKIKKPATNLSLTRPIKTAILIGGVLLLGFFGGLAGSRVLPDRITSLDTTSAQQKIVSSQSELISTIAETVSPSVVSINIESTSAQGFFGETTTSEGAGTGIILSSDGIVITNRHVVSSNTSKITITTNDGKTYDNVTVLARDPRTNFDIAFLKIQNVNDLKPAKLGDSTKMKIGDAVVAIGNALGEFANTVTSGIISGSGRPVVASDGGSYGSAESLTNLFQTDAAINPGNSGGPLVNMNGEVIGINTAVAGNAENIGFSIPINDVKTQITSILDKGKLEIPYMGVRYVVVSDALQKRYSLGASEGAWLKTADENQAVINGSPADKAGLKEGDIITKVNNEKVNSDTPLAARLSKYAIGDTVEITYVRDGKEATAKVTIEKAPDNS